MLLLDGSLDAAQVGGCRGGGCGTAVAVTTVAGVPARSRNFSWHAGHVEVCTLDVDLWPVLCLHMHEFLLLYGCVC